MKIVFHIGMGKTGTSSIQRVLQKCESQLAEQKACYLGMWPEMLTGAKLKHDAYKAVFQCPADEQEGYATSLHEYLTNLSEKDGFETYILSNESLFGTAGAAETFFKKLIELMEVQFVAYVRNPYDWLPSAYAQWGIRHKVTAGPIRSFAEHAPSLVQHYNPVQYWHERFGGNLSVRLFDKKIDIVQDFSKFTGITLDAPEERILPRGEDAELIVRALYNNGIPGQAWPQRFNQRVMNTDVKPVASLSSFADKCFDQSAQDEIIEGNREIFEYIHEKFNINLLEKPEHKKEKKIDGKFLWRVFDYFVAISMEQSERIAKLEKEIRAMKTE